MKVLLAAGLLFASLSAFGQHLPDNKSWGLKAGFNYYFPSYKADNADAQLTNNANTGFGGGAYFRYDFTPLYSFQSEVLVATRSGSVSNEIVTQPDPTITITESSVSNLAQTTVEIPLNFKMRWEFIPRHTGAWKSNSMLGVVTGPRVVMNMMSSRSTSSSQVTELFNQTSTEIRTLTSSTASDYFSPVTVGWEVGVDYECLSRLVLHAKYYRGLMSMNKTGFGYKSFDNRVEVGVGIRCW